MAKTIGGVCRRIGKTGQPGGSDPVLEIGVHARKLLGEFMASPVGSDPWRILLAQSRDRRSRHYRDTGELETKPSD
jgi:hypothetical protein